MQNGEWSTPDPSFSGKIVVNDNDEFYGYCDELYDDVGSEINRARFLVGAFATNRISGKKGISFYKLSNYELEAPLMYLVPDLDEEGSWAAIVAVCSFMQAIPQGKSRIVIEEETYSKDEEDRIKQKYDKLDKENWYNSKLLDQIHCCKDCIVHFRK